MRAGGDRSTRPVDLQSIPGVRRPLIPVALAYGVGVFAGALIPLGSLPVLAGLLLVVGATALALWAGRLPLATVLVVAGFLLFGVLRYLQAVHPQGPFHLSRVPETWLTDRVGLEGTIISFPESVPPGSGWRQEERIRFLMEVDAITVHGERYQAEGGVRLSILSPVLEYRYGHRLHGEFRLRRPRGYWNPGAFNYRRHAWSRGFYLEGWGREGTGVRILDRAGGWGIMRAVSDLRATMLARIDAAFPEEEGGVLRAMVLGDQSELSPAVQAVFLRSGTYHILVISGLHIGFLAGLLFFVSRAARLPRTASCVITVIGVGGYTLLAGSSPPIVRAALMTGLYLLAVVVGRERDLANALALAAFLLLLWNPLYLFDAGFQLTFTATGAILAAVSHFDAARFPRLMRWLVILLVTSAAATVATAPLLAFHFNRVSLTGIAANLVIVPLSGCLTAMGIGTTLVLLLVPAGVSVLGTATSVLARGMTEAAAFFAALPLASIRVYTPTPLMVLSCYALFGLLVIPGVRRRGLAVGVVVGLVLVQVGWKLLPRESRGIEVTFLDVGQGDSIFLSLPGGRTMLMDGGGTLDDRFDIGERVVAPYLWHRWLRRMDVVVLSHPQPDHLQGLRAVLEEFPVGEVWESGYSSFSPTYRWLQDFVREKAIPLRKIARGDRIPLGGDVVVTVLHPPRSFFRPPKGRAVVNNNSLVLRVEHPEFRLLLTGDIEAEAEVSLLEAGLPLDADLLKVPHHGSRGSSSVEFLRRAQPRWAVVQAGHRNPFGHPHVETLTRYAEERVQVLRTDRDGAVTFEWQGGAMTMRTHREALGVWAAE